MKVKFYVIRLSAEERDELTSLVRSGGYRRRNARILRQSRGNTDLLVDKR